MTGKADVIRAVSQQFKDRTNTVIEGVMAHLRDDNAKEILGPGLSPLIGRGTLKGLVTFAVYADVLRMVRDTVMADGEISDEEVQESLGLLQNIAGGFAKVRRKDYAAFQQLTPETARDFLSQYESDTGLFGHANESTKWAGVTLCSGVKTLCDDPAPITELHSLLMAWAQSLAETDGTAGVEQEVLRSLKSLLHAHALAGEGTAGNDGEAHVLTEAIAEAFLEDISAVDIEAFTHITDDAAKVLGEYADWWLRLDGLTTLSDAAAESLGKNREHRGALSLNGLTTLSDEAAEALTQHKGDLYLSGLTTLSDEAAKALAKHEGSLYLDGLTTLSDAAIEALAKHSGGWLSLSGLISLSDKAAEALAQHSSGLSLDGLISLSDKAAEALAVCRGGLSLSGLTAISDTQIKLLAKHSGGLLCLNGLTTLSNVASEALANHDGKLSLDGLATLSDAAIESLAKNGGGGLFLSGLTNLSDAAIEALAKHEGDLSLNGLTWLSDKAAEALAKRGGGGELELNGLTTLSDNAAKALGEFQGALFLDGLTTFTDHTAVALAKQLDIRELIAEGRIEFTSMEALKLLFPNLDLLLARSGDCLDNDNDEDEGEGSEWDEDEGEDDSEED